MSGQGIEFVLSSGDHQHRVTKYWPREGVGKCGALALDPVGQSAQRTLLHLRDLGKLFMSIGDNFFGGIGRR